ncbi:MAG: hypothetical protein C4540_06070 [Candidatus Omnitrophota bacterium]|nr:MAG: hypothetical protein C4540_06070 [Candidatus Omnitrophota bacterium]
MRKVALDMRKKLIQPKVFATTIIVLCFFSVLSFSQELPRQGESISIVTYYPSPYGSYNQLSVAAGGLRLGKTLEKVSAHTWTDIDITSLPAGGLYIISVIPADEDPFLTYMIMFSAEKRAVGLNVLPGVIADSSVPTYEFEPQRSREVKEWLRKRELAQFRAQILSDTVSFVLQVKTTKECSVRVGKILSYWTEHDQ